MIDHYTTGLSSHPYQCVFYNFRRPRRRTGAPARSRRDWHRRGEPPRNIHEVPFTNQVLPAEEPKEHSVLPEARASDAACPSTWVYVAILPGTQEPRA